MKRWNRVVLIAVLFTVASAWGYTKPIDGQTTETVTNLWDLGPDNLYVGSNTYGNAMVVANGGHVKNSEGRVGVWSGASNNSVIVTGTGSVWENSGIIFVGVVEGGNSSFRSHFLPFCVPKIFRGIPIFSAAISNGQ